MKKEEIIATINPVIAEEFEIEEDQIQPDAPIYETLDLDSISLVDLVGIVNVHFHIRIEKEDLTSIRTFADLYDYIERKNQ